MSIEIQVKKDAYVLKLTVFYEKNRVIEKASMTSSSMLFDLLKSLQRLG